MVYCGKPSRGCQMCRTRRIKCDETKPACNQCTKSRRQCPGYKDEFELVFRNETKATERRAQRASRKTTAQRHPARADSSTSSSSPAGESPSSTTTLPAAPPAQWAIIPAMSIPHDQQASCYFVSNFVLIPREGGTRGFMDYLVPLLKHDPPRPCLKHAFSACSLAALGNRIRSSGVNLKDQALAEYTKAISAVYSALRDPDLGREDATLASIMLLGFFENIATKQMGMFAWGSHIEGAIQLVKARGKKQLRTKTGLLLFIAVRTMMIIYSLSTGKAPVLGADWWMSEAVMNESAAQCQTLNIKTAELRAEVTRLMATVDRTSDNIELMLSLIRRAQTYDDECAAWMRAVPEHWRYRTVAWEDNVPNGDYSKAEVFPGRVDVYRDFWIASVWNMVRCSRLILASISVRCAAWVCAPIDYRTTPEYAAASRTCIDTITDIVASVPYHLGWHRSHRDLGPDEYRHHCSPTTTPTPSSSPSGFACGDEDSLKALAGFFVTWPLACVRGQDYATDAQRAWVAGRLRFIGEELGVHYALMLLQLRLRFPSMLIRQDGLAAQPPHPAARDFEKMLLSSSSAREASGRPLQRLPQQQQRDAVVGQGREQQKAQQARTAAEKLARAPGGAAVESGPWGVQKMLRV